MAPSYQSLPVELLSRVAELVHEQDLAFAASPVPRADSPTSNKPGKHVDVTGGTWSYWHGRGIRALAQVDRRSRTAAVPILYQSITAKQTSTLYFRLEVLGEPLGAFVRHVDVDTVYDAHIAPLACALRKLPNLTSVKLGYEVVRDCIACHDEVELPEDFLALKSSMRHALGKVKSLEVDVIGQSSLLKTLVCVDGARLRKLHWVDPEWPSEPDVELECAVRSLVGLVELEVSNLYLQNYDDLRRCPPFPTVLSLVLRGTHGDDHKNLALAHYLAPSVTRLAIYYGVVESPFDDELEPLPRPLLPTLKSLIVEATSCPPVFDHLNLGALEHFKMTHKRACIEFPLDIDEVPFKGAPVRTITLAFRASPLVKASKKVLRLLDAAGVHLVVEQSPLSVPQLKATGRVGGSPANTLAVARRAHSQLVNTLDWARRRADWLDEVDDAPGLHELAHATARLHERYLMDRA
ncbi:hypothetical protein JCM3775_001149 [Rhodotorula graminis]|uniref:Uncharacterized protein n=1 Tax=Rhodotorula graminis (strain WP1) TaxID=578459 RepID=A0A0P9EJH7_RHOGW|nr:uncharacterized protein RHOBADRAFT_56428 [Rhodotorula graminis WP1]KPV71815.1 hypothetical protein RHOBADRAFT_56428 [Rhodotorula graminis WP1]